MAVTCGELGEDSVGVHAGTPPSVGSAERLEWLQVGRAFAALMVVAYHAATTLENAYGHAEGELWPWAHLGKSGVDLFFCISGFIIFHVHRRDIGQPAALPRYLYRRASRIYPPYLVLLALVLPLYFLIPSSGAGYQRDLWHIIGNALLLPVPPKPIIGVAWTLVLEIIFYAAFAVLILNRRVGAAVFLIWGGAIAVNFVQPLSDNFLVQTIVSRRFIEFFAGVGLAYGYSRLPPRLMLGFGLSAGSVYVAALWMDEGRLYFLLIAAASVAMLAFLLTLDRRQFAAPRILTFVGNASYSIYLFHWPVGWAIGKALPAASLTVIPPLLVLPFMAAAMTAGGLLAHIWIEKPLLAASSAFYRRQRRLTP